MALSEDGSQPVVGYEGQTNSYGHVLSEKSSVLQRDTFFFVPAGGHSIRLFIGVNQKLTPLRSARHLERWVRLISASKQERFFWCPVQLRPYGILSYVLSPSGPAISSDSDEPLPPGNYGWFTNRELTETDRPRTTPALESFDFLSQYGVEQLEGRDMLLYRISPEVLSLASARDKGCCRITGDSVDVVLTTIVPCFCWWLLCTTYSRGDPPLRDEDSETLRVTAYDCPANVLTLRADLKHHFHNHNFTIDVDDNYRVVVLRDMGDAQKLLPTHFVPHPTPEVHPDSTTFLRLHLRYSLSFMLLGGDVSDTYPPHVIINEMDALGVPGPGADPDHEMLPLDDKRWQTVLGKAILENVFHTQMEESRYWSKRGSGGEELTSETDSSGSASRGE